MEFSRPLLSALLLTAVLATPGARAQTTPPPAPASSFTTLKALRAVGLPKLPDYTLDQQKLVLSQAKLLLLDMYAHLHLKEQKFGVDPAKRITALEDVLNEKGRTEPMPQADFHDAMMKMFIDERDLHTTYSRPVPLQCYASSMPFSMDPVRTWDPVKRVFREELAVSKISTSVDVLKLSPGIEKVSVGDVVEGYDGVNPIDKLAQIDTDPDLSVEELGGGANRKARHRRAIERMAMVSQTGDPFPAQDEVTFRLRKRDGSKLTISFPWIVAGTLSCLGQKPTPAPAASGSISSVSIEEYEHRFEETYRQHTSKPTATPGGDPLLDLSAPKNTAEPILHYKVLVRKEAGQPDRSFGYLRLDSFAPSSDFEDVIEIVKGLLTKEFAGTDGLLIDLRNNGGGFISFGEELIQLFAPAKVTPEGFRLRATQSNLDYLKVSNHFADDFIPLLNDAIAKGRVYTGTAPITSPNAANARGQVYFKPVAILTNSSCYSTCDMFTAGMQDNHVADIWSEDENTGGGGANNVHYADFQSMLAAVPPGQPITFSLPALPAGQNMGIAWRQAVRVGLHANELLEDRGVLADHGRPSGKTGYRYELASSPDDLALAYLQTVRTITDAMIAEGPDHASTVAFEIPGETLDVELGQTPALEAKLTGTSRVDTFSESSTGEQQIGSQKIDPTASSVAITMSLPPRQNSGRLAFQGYLGDKPVWRKTLVYRETPRPATAPYTWDLVSAMDGLALYTPANPMADGWQIKDGQLRIGSGPTYLNDLTTDASLFVTIPAGTTPKLSFTAKVDSEPDSDFFSVSAIDSKATSTQLVKLSGQVAQAPYSYDLTPYAGQTIELRFRFTSDPSVALTGVFLNNISVK